MSARLLGAAYTARTDALAGTITIVIVIVILIIIIIITIIIMIRNKNNNKSSPNRVWLRGSSSSCKGFAWLIIVTVVTATMCLFLTC